MNDASGYSPCMERGQDPRPTLVAYGAPLAGYPAARDMSLEAAVVSALGRLEDDSTLTLVLPVVLAKNARHLDLTALTAEAKAAGLLARLGMLLDVTAEVTPLHSVREVACQLFAFRNPEPVFLPAPRSRFGEQLARLRTPSMVRRWGFLMNVSEDSLRTFARKHLGS